ncbi:hypothetical protein LOTGIDRAFT_223470 [Lottia gigantea]|uniref:Longin domain-containing protein n=1 Tax=Lottia gigantea TaxID=225164 RepID=V3ZMZ5_LOTGI|nr:hypothetical protein LOTGIDRAFT_223470 [Lottia gigantea]ESO82206.1 hypothetical protein LOTGIDRAFT_223470 [Lottia gigantea]
MALHFVLVVRTRDGLPLTGSTDGSSTNQDHDYQEAYKDLKLLSRKSAQFTDRCTYTSGRFHIHFTSARGLTFLVLTDINYPTVLTFSFLNDLMKEFLQQYRHEKTDVITRPYAYIDFAMFMHKTKSKYNSTRFLSTKINISDLNQELKLRPPYSIPHAELYPELGSKSTSFRTPGRGLSKDQLVERILVNLIGWVSTALNILCACLHLVRGVAVMNDEHLHEFSSDLFQYGVTFMLCSVFFLYQIYLMVCPTKMRKPLACGTLGSICLCQLYLWEYRTNVEILFHVCVGCTATFVIFTRKIQQKLPQYNL